MKTCTGDLGCNVKKKKQRPTYKISIPPGSVLRKQQLILLGKELAQQSNVMNTALCKAKISVWQATALAVYLQMESILTR